MSEPPDPTYKGPPPTHRTAPLTHDESPTGDAAELALVAAVLSPVAPDRYRVGAEFARGGLGRILRAHDQHLRRPVAVKQLLATRPEAARRFIREALITARLQHPSIVPIYEAGRWPTGEPFYAMKLVEGRSLDRVLEGCKTLAERLALLPNLVAVAEAMAYAHGQRIIHRDLKPANVLVGSFGETVVIDWGLAKDLSTGEATPDERMPFSDETESGTVLGTPTYMPPEQAEGKVVDERADVYAIGAIVYHVLAGAPPYDGASSAETLARVLAAPAPSLAKREPGVPRDLCAVVDKAMAREAAARYPTAKELADELARFQTGQLVRAHRYSSAERLQRWLRQRRAALSVATALLLTAALASGLAVSRIARERAEARAALATAEARAAALTREARELQGLLLPSPLVRAREVPRQVKRALDGEVRSPDGTRTATATRDALFTIDDAGTRLRLDGGANEVAFSPDGRLVSDGARLWDWAAGSARHFAAAPARHLAWSPAGDRLATVDDGGALTLWTLPEARARTLGGGDRVAFAPDGATLAASERDGTVRLWRVSDGSGRALGAHRGAVAALAFSPDGARLASGGDDGALRIWRTATGECEVARAAGPVRAIAWSGERLFVMTADGAIAAMESQ